MKGYANSFNGWIDKKDIKMCEYFPEPKSWGGRVKVELELELSWKCNRCWYIKICKKGWFSQPKI